MKTSNASVQLAQSMQMVNCETDEVTLPVEVEIRIRENVFLRGFHHSVKIKLHFSEINLHVTRITSIIALMECFHCPTPIPTPNSYSNGCISVCTAPMPIPIPIPMATAADLTLISVQLKCF